MVNGSIKVEADAVMLKCDVATPRRGLLDNFWAINELAKLGYLVIDNWIRVAYQDRVESRGVEACRQALQILLNTNKEKEVRTQRKVRVAEAGVFDTRGEADSWNPTTRILRLVNVTRTATVSPCEM